VSKRALEAFGVSEQITSLTLPIGATLNMHGSALYQSILLIFMSHLAGADVSPLQALFIVMLTMASSAGTAGIPGGGIAMMAFMLDLLGLPPPTWPCTWWWTASSITPSRPSTSGATWW